MRVQYKSKISCYFLWNFGSQLKAPHVHFSKRLRCWAIIGRKQSYIVLARVMTPRLQCGDVSSHIYSAKTRWNHHGELRNCKPDKEAKDKIVDGVVGYTVCTKKNDTLPGRLLKKNTFPQAHVSIAEKTHKQGRYQKNHYCLKYDLKAGR